MIQNTHEQWSIKSKRIIIRASYISSTHSNTTCSLNNCLELTSNGAPQLKKSSCILLSRQLIPELKNPILTINGALNYQGTEIFVICMPIQITPNSLINNIHYSRAMEHETVNVQIFCFTCNYKNTLIGR
jgi:hypothetical protein